MDQLQQEVNEILDAFFPRGLPPNRVKEALDRGYCRIVDSYEVAADEKSA
jgi:hypothetical protein